MAVPDTAVTANLYETLDVKSNLFSEITLNPVLPVNKLAKTVNLVFGKVAHFNIRINTSPA
jgi:hypothetical protein